MAGSMTQRIRNYLATLVALVTAVLLSAAVGEAAEGVQGRVTFANGKPAAQVFVQARPLGPSGPPVPDIGIFTDSAGRYSWPLPPGRFELTFVHEGKKLTTRRITVGRTGVTPLDVRLSDRK
jgi:hypothetical protein